MNDYKLVIEYLKEYLMSSSLPIEEVSMLMGILNYAEDGCVSSLCFYDEWLINKDLKRVLEIL